MFWRMERFRELEVPELELRVLGSCSRFGKVSFKAQSNTKLRVPLEVGGSRFGVQGMILLLRGLRGSGPETPSPGRATVWRFRVLDLQIPENLFRSGAQTVATSNAPGLSD